MTVQNGQQRQGIIPRLKAVINQISIIKRSEKYNRWIYSGAAFTIGQYMLKISWRNRQCNGSMVCLRYNNNKAQDSICRKFGTSQIPKSNISSFALETAANDTAVNAVIGNAVDYLEGKSTAVQSQDNISTFQFQLHQNYLIHSICTTIQSMYRNRML